ncbi:MAG TPA: ATP-binding cassette domain-containing protein, partial [Chloroflexota bacterium]|nr:ATP-binding cassette domain-containing protein [Chloroflexota bacterium]
MTATAEARSGASTASDDPTLDVKDLKVAVDGREILHGIDFQIRKGEVHAILGPNGSGKSTLAYALMGSPRYEVTAGEVEFKGEDLLALATDERARA